MKTLYWHSNVGLIRKGRGIPSCGSLADQPSVCSSNQLPRHLSVHFLDLWPLTSPTSSMTKNGIFGQSQDTPSGLGPLAFGHCKMAVQIFRVRFQKEKKYKVWLSLGSLARELLPYYNTFLLFMAREVGQFRPSPLNFLQLCCWFLFQ